jgi:hypothetical protein
MSSFSEKISRSIRVFFTANLLASLAGRVQNEFDLYRIDNGVTHTSVSFWCQEGLSAVAALPNFKEPPCGVLLVSVSGRF